MSQATIESGIVGTIRLHDDFDDANCKLYDRRPMGKGLPRLAIVSYNSHSQEHLTIQLDRRRWIYNVDVLVPWRGELAELDTRIVTEAQKIVDILAQYPRLNATAGVQRAELSISARPDLIQERKGVYRGRRHTLEVLEIVNPGRVE